MILKKVALGEAESAEGPGTDLTRGGRVAHGGGVLAVQLRGVVVQVQRLDGHHHPGHLAGVVWKSQSETGSVNLIVAAKSKTVHQHPASVS